MSSFSPDYDHGFEDWLYERFAGRTVYNTVKALNHIAREEINWTNRDNVMEWLRNLRRIGKPASTINDYIKPYNRYMEFTGQPKIKLFKQAPPHKIQRATDSDYELLMKACSGYTRERSELMIQLSFRCGLRLMEFSNLKTSSLRDDVITVLGKGEKTRDVYADSMVRDAWKKYMRVRKANSNTDKLLVNQYGDPMTYHGIKNSFYDLARKAGIEFSTHRARRFFARKAKDEGLDLDEVRLLMGHSSADTTLLYTQPDQLDAVEALRKRARKREGFFDEGSEPIRPGTVFERPGRDLNPSHELDRLV